MTTPELTRFLDHLDATDDLAALLRGHLYVEHGIITSIEERLPHREHFNVQNLRFPDKVGLAIALGILRPQDRQVLLKFNSLRNKTAHRLEHVISQGDIADIYQSFDSTLRALADGAVEGRDVRTIDLRTMLLVLVMAFHGELSDELVEGWDSPSASGS